MQYTLQPATSLLTKDYEEIKSKTLVSDDLKSAAKIYYFQIITILILLLLTMLSASAQKNFNAFELSGEDKIQILISETDSIRQTEISTQRLSLKKKLTASVLIILTGPLGGHRLFLGTHPVVPVFYAVTLGGGFGVLPLIDLITLWFGKNKEHLLNNKRIFMWVD